MASRPAWPVRTWLSLVPVRHIPLDPAGARRPGADDSAFRAARSNVVRLGAPTLEEVAAELARCPLDGPVKTLVQLVVQLKDPQTSRRDVELAFAAKIFSDQLLGQVQTRIRNGEYLFTAHNILTLIGYALRHCYTGDAGEPELASLAWTALALNEHLGTESQIDEPVPDLGLRIDGEPRVCRAVDNTQFCGPLMRWS